MFYSEHAISLIRSRRLLRSCRSRRAEMRLATPCWDRPFEYKRLGECMWFVAKGYNRSFFFLFYGLERCK